MNIGIIMGCVISPLLFILVMEMILHSAEVNTNEITCPFMKAFMDDVTLVAESKSHMEQLVTHLQELFKWAAMKIKPPKWKSKSRLSLVFQRISNKQKKNGFRRNSSSCGSQVYCYSCRTKETRRMGRVQKIKLSHGATLSTRNPKNWVSL